MGKEFAEIKSMLSVEEPNYPEYVTLIGEDDISVLAEMAKGENIGLAAKAVHMAGFFRTKTAFKVIEGATSTKSYDPYGILKIAAATTLKKMPNSIEKTKLSRQLLKSDDPSVQKIVLKSVLPDTYIRPRFVRDIKQITLKSQHEFLQKLAYAVLDNRKTGFWAYTKDTISLWFGPKEFKAG
jgi:hypothetical protein